MADFTVPRGDINRVANEIGRVLRDGAYVAIGLGVLGFQRAQVRRVERTRQLDGYLRQRVRRPATAASPAHGAADLVHQLGELGERLDRALAPAWEMGRQFVEVNPVGPEQLDSARVQLRQLVGDLDALVQPWRQQVDEQFDLLEPYLPPAARALLRSLRVAVAEPETRQGDAARRGDRGDEPVDDAVDDVVDAAAEDGWPEDQPEDGPEDLPEDLPEGWT